MWLPYNEPFFFFFFWHILGCTFCGLAWFPLVIPVVMTDVNSGHALGSDFTGLSM